MGKALRLGGTLFAVTAVTGLILGYVEFETRKAIERTHAEAKAEALRNVMPEAESFKAVEMTAPDDAIADVQEALSGAERVGYCLTVQSKGYGGLVGFVVGVTNKGTVRAINILSHSETPGLGAKSTEPEFYGQFENRAKLPLKVVKGTAEAEDEISAISGATITSNAVTSGVNAAVEYWSKNLKEGQK
ncbi:MAG: RnfABCDGE type electron transport complex subunit G [Synergistaceae bacterium]|nr:RnfABCDGE type electron transport complex subunit G [Synergistaceae bacterium]